MTNPAVIVVTAVVVGVAAIWAIISLSNRPQATSYDRRGSSNGSKNRRFSPPPSPPPSSFTGNRGKRRKSPKKCSYSGHESDSKSTEKLCKECGESPFVKVNPCNHEYFCKDCFSTYLKSNYTCPACVGRIDSISPTISPFGKCKSCRKFTELFKFLPCNHSLSLCISCFEKQDESYKVCPECKKPFQSCEPKSTTTGLCKVCEQFTQFAIFQPCGHGNFCRKHAEAYLKDSNECFDCGETVMKIQ